MRLYANKIKVVENYAFYDLHNVRRMELWGNNCTGERGKKKRERKKEGEERMELWGNNYWGKRGGRERW